MQTAPPPGSASLADLEAELQVLNKPIDDLKKRVKSLQSGTLFLMLSTVTVRH